MSDDHECGKIHNHFCSKCAPKDYDPDRGFKEMQEAGYLWPLDQKLIVNGKPRVKGGTKDWN